MSPDRPLLCYVAPVRYSVAAVGKQPTQLSSGSPRPFAPHTTQLGSSLSSRHYQEKQRESKTEWRPIDLLKQTKGLIECLADRHRNSPNSRHWRFGPLSLVFLKAKMPEMHAFCAEQRGQLQIQETPRASCSAAGWEGSGINAQDSYEAELSTRHLF